MVEISGGLLIPSVNMWLFTIDQLDSLVKASIAQFAKCNRID